MEIIKDRDFIERYIISLYKLYEDKLLFYTNMLDEIQNEIYAMREDFIDYRRNDPGAKMQDLYPTFVSTNNISREIKKIINTINLNLRSGFNTERWY